jgi:hypothetical protein
MFVVNVPNRIPSSILKADRALGSAAAVYAYLKSQG